MSNHLWRRHLGQNLGGGKVEDKVFDLLAKMYSEMQEGFGRNEKKFSTLERKISLQVIQFVDQVLVNTRSSILTVCKASLCFACQGQQILAFS